MSRAMTPERWQQVKGVLQQVLEISPPHRAAFLSRACDGDEPLRLEVESLLMNEEAHAEGFLETPLWTSAVFESALSDSWVGRRIGAYEIVDLIGEGGMGRCIAASAPMSSMKSKSQSKSFARASALPSLWRSSELKDKSSPISITRTSPACWTGGRPTLDSPIW